MQHDHPTLQSLIESLANYGDKPCIVALQEHHTERWRYAQLVDEVQRLAAGLIAAGVERGEHVVLLAKNRPEWYVASFATLLAGAVVTPLDTNITDDALAHTLRDSEARWIFTTTEYLHRLARLGSEAMPRPVLLDVAADDRRGWRALQTSKPTSLPRVQPNDGAVLFYTSGTTGVPKGVPLTHQNLAFQVASLLQSGVVTTADSALLPLPMYHVYPFMIGLVVMALGTYIVLPNGVTGPQIRHAMQEGQPTVIIGVPRLYRALYTGIETQATASVVAGPIFRRLLALSMWLRRRWGKQAGKLLFGTVHRRLGAPLRLMASGGSALDPQLAEKLEALGWQIAIGYGLTETSPLLTLNLPNSRRLGSAGKPIPGVELRIDTTASSMDGEAFTTVANGTPPQGEVLARGPSVFRGYRNLPDRTARAFTADGWFRTGDLGYFDQDSFLYITGRVNTMIVLEGGKNIQPEPLEDVYTRHPCVQEVGILQAGHQLAAVIVPNMVEVNRLTNGNVELAVRNAVSTLAEHLPTYQRITEYVVSLEPLPKTNLGKIRRHQLAEMYRQIKAGIAITSTPVRPLAPEDMTEADRALLDHPAAQQTWKLLAARYHDRALTPDSNPQLDLGIDSLGWLTLTLEIADQTGVELVDEAISRISTVRDLLREVRAASDTGMRQDTALAVPEAELSPQEHRWLQPTPALLTGMRVLLLMANRVLMRRLFRLEVRGLEDLPAGAPIVLAPNHRSYLDSFALAAALPYRHLMETYWAAAADVLFRNAPMRFISRLLRVVPIARNVGTGRSALSLAARVLQHGHNLVWYPEGSMTRTGSLLPFRRGLGLVLENVPATVVPVYIRGTDEALPVDRLRLRFRPVTVTFGRPCTPRELAYEGVGENAAARIVAALHTRVAALAGKVSHAPEEVAEEVGV